MSKVKISNVSKDYIKDNVDEFLKVVITLDSKEEVIDFFIGLLTQSEAVMFGRRIKIAKMIMNNNTYDEIVRELSVSKNSITKTDYWLNSRDGKYKKVLGKCFRRVRLRKNEFINMDKYPIYKIVLKTLNLR